MIRGLWAGVGLLCVAQVFGQQIRGLVVDEAGEPLSELLVHARHPRMEVVVLASAWTDEEGRFVLECAEWAECVLDVESSFFALERRVRAACGDSVRLVARYRAHQIGDVVVRGTAIPIIDRGDTIIYQVDRLARPEDLTLEDLLRRMPDIEVDESGQVKFRGKPIDRILIEGEWLVLDHALLTRTLSPQMVARMEIRTKEDNTQLKRQLLDRGPMLVLDIELGEQVREEGFGQVSLDVGTQSSLWRPDIHGSVFSLKPNLKVLGYGNWDYFDRKVISGDQLRQLDPDAYRSIFQLPAHPDLLREREVYHSDVFGFDDYFSRAPRVAGLSGKWKWGRRWVLRPSVLVELDRVARYYHTTTRLIDRNGSDIRWWTSDRDRYAALKSRLPIQYRMDERNWLTIDFFFHLRADSARTERSVGALPAEYRSELRSGQFDFMGKYEHSGRRGWRFSVDGRARRFSGTRSVWFTFSDEPLRPLFFDTTAVSGGAAWSMDQDLRRELTVYSVGAQGYKEWGNFSFGLAAQVDRHFVSSRLSTSASEPLRGDESWGGEVRWPYVRLYPRGHIRYENEVLRLELHAGVDRTYWRRGGWERVAHYPVWGGSLFWSLGLHEEIQLRYFQSPARVWVEAVGEGLLVADPFGWLRLSPRLWVGAPQANAQWSVRSDRWKEALGLRLDFTGVYGSVRNAFAVDVLLPDPFWQEESVAFYEYGYVLGGLMADWQARKVPGVKAQWSAFVFQTARRNTGDLRVANRIFIHGLEFHGSPSQSSWGVHAKLAMRSFFTVVDRQAPVPWLQSLSAALNLSRSFWQEQLVVSLGWRSISHFRALYAPLRTVDVKCSYHLSDQFSAFFEGFNLFDQRVQSKVEISPVGVSTFDVRLFPRVFRLGFRKVFL